MSKRVERPTKAIVLMLLATLSFVAMQTAVKFARQVGLDTSEVMFVRTAPGLPVLWWMLQRKGQGVRPVAPRSLFARSLFGSMAMGLNFASMRSLSLSQFSTLGLSQPVFVALASPLFLRERVAGSTWLAMALSFAGAWVLLDPSANTQQIPVVPAAFAIGSALASAVAHIWVRIAAEQDPPERVVFHFSAWVSLVSLLAGVTNGHFRSLPPALALMHFAALTLALAAFGLLGQLLMTYAYVHAEAAKVSIVGYSSIALGMLVDTLVFEIPPSSGFLLGAVLMLLAGYLLMRARAPRG
ncbi:MAG: DMT family transporter [Myxococcales bacterium]